MKKRIALLLAFCTLISFLPVSHAEAEGVRDVFLNEYRSGDYDGTVQRLDVLVEGGDEFAATLLAFGCITNGSFADAYLLHHANTDFVALTDQLKEYYENGSLAAGMILGYIHLWGLMTDADEETARSYFDPTEAALISLAAANPLAARRITAEDFGSGSAEIEPGNSVSNPIIALYIGMCYYYGLGGLEKDPETAAIWFGEGVRLGLPEALFSYSEMIRNQETDGTLSEYQYALDLLARTYGYNLAAYRLAVLEGYQGKVEESMETMKFAAELGNDRAQLMMVTSNGNGLVVDVDLVAQFKALEEAEALALEALEASYNVTDAPEAVLNARNAVVRVMVLYYNEEEKIIAYRSCAGCIGAGMQIGEMMDRNWKFVLAPWSVIDPYSVDFEFSRYQIAVAADGLVYNVEQVGMHGEKSADLGIFFLYQAIPDRDFVMFCQDGSVSVGDTVYALGFSENRSTDSLPSETRAEEEIIRAGVITDLDAQNGDLSLITASAVIGSQMVGGPMLNEQGDMVGMVLSGSAEDGGIYVLSAQDIIDILTDFGLPSAFRSVEDPEAAA